MHVLLHVPEAHGHVVLWAHAVALPPLGAVIEGPASLALPGVVVVPLEHALVSGMAISRDARNNPDVTRTAAA